MARPPKPTFITELPLVVSQGQDSTMVARFEAARRLSNAVLGDGLKALALMRESKAWAAARACRLVSSPAAGAWVHAGCTRVF